GGGTGAGTEEHPQSARRGAAAADCQAALHLCGKGLSVVRTVIPIVAAPTLAATSTVVTASGLQTPPPLSLYIHWPWCVKKCPYCDFNSHETKGEIPEANYINAV